MMHVTVLASLAVLLLASPSHSLPSHDCQNAHKATVRDQANLPTWRRVSDYVIHRIAGLPQKALDAPKIRNGPRKTSTGLSRSVLARYGDEIVLRFTIRSQDEARALADAADILFLDVWEANEGWVDLRLAKDVVPSLLRLLPQSLRTSHKVLMQDLDLAQAVFDTYPSSSAHTRPQPEPSTPFFTHQISSIPSANTENIFFNDYQPLSVIRPWLSLLRSMFPTHVRLLSIGESYEGQTIPAVRVGVHPTNDEEPHASRQTIVVSGGSHAREWIGTSTVNYLLWSFITSYGKSATITKLVEQYDWVFIPTINPDGYDYTWNNDRLWRKNRQPTNLRFCQGVDIDRSFSFQWDGEQSRSNPCSESFAGDEAFESVEARALADWARNETENHGVEFVGFLDLHSYSQQVLYPYSFSCDDQPPNEEDLEETALGLAKAIRLAKGGHFYTVGRACEGNVAVFRDGKDRKIFPRMETGGGSALDWFYHEMHVKYAYQIKLRDTGSYGFLLPRENIVPTGKETLDALLYLGRSLIGDVDSVSDTPDEGIERLHGLMDGAMAPDSLADSSEVKMLDAAGDEDSIWELRRRRR